MSSTIWLAVVSDAALLADLGATAFQEAFAADNTPEDMTAYLSETFTEERLHAELSDPLSTFLIAELSGRPVGYAKLCISEPDSSVTGIKPIELVRLYLLAECIGQGIGAALMDACINHAKSQGFETVWLGVWERNIRAQKFYYKWGFEPVGSHIFKLGNDMQTDFIFQRSLNSQNIITQELGDEQHN